MSRETKTALVVDDESSDLEALAAALGAAGYRVITATDGKTAEESFRAQPDKIDVLVTDIAMSPISGFELARRLVNQKPHLGVIFVSGLIGAMAFMYLRPVPHFGFLRKPFTQGDLVKMVSAKTRNAGLGGDT